MLNQISKKASTEHLLLALFLSISVVMFIEAFSFSERARMFPQVMAAVTVASSLLLLLREYVPNRVSDVLFTSADIGQKEITTEDEIERNRTDLIVLAALVVGYVVLSYLISFIYASPIFVLVYTLYHRKAWYKVVVLTLLGYAIPFAFHSTLGGPIDSGLLL